MRSFQPNSYERTEFHAGFKFDRCVLRKVVIHSIGPVLVVLGIAGEVVFEGRAFILEDIQESDSQATIAELKAESSANELEAARLHKEAEDEHAARVKIEARVAWRRLTKDQQSVIADHLKNFAEVRVGLSYLGGIPEASQFADDIKVALNAAKLKLHPREPFSLFGGYGGGVYPLQPLTGVNISGVVNRGPEVAAAIQRELCAIGFDTTITGKPEAAGITEPNPDIDLEVLVVGRPVTEQGVKQLKINAKTKDCTATD